MQCMSCGHDNLPGADHCEECHASLTHEDVPLARIESAIEHSLSKDEVRRLAGLPPMPGLQAQLLSVFNSPATQLASVFAGSVRQLMNVLKAYSEAEGEAAPAA